WRAIRPRRLLVIVLLHFWSVLRVLESLLVMLATALWDAMRYRPGWQMLKTELRVFPMRVGISAVIREIITQATCIHPHPGLPIIPLNFLGSDEDAHVRGPRSRTARSSLPAIDGCVARIARAARRSRRRDYQVWIYADHGQEDVLPFVVRHGVSVPHVVEET